MRKRSRLRYRVGHGRRKQLHAAQGGRCFYCEEPIEILRPLNDPAYASIDHFYPRAKGGRKNLGNVVLSCIPCNIRKADRLPTPQEVMKWKHLAETWPHVYAPASVPQNATKMCVVCGEPVPWERLFTSLRCGRETETCSRRCGSAAKRNRRRMKYERRALLEQRKGATEDGIFSRKRGHGNAAGFFFGCLWVAAIGLISARYAKARRRA